LAIELNGYIGWMQQNQRSKGTITDYCYELKKLPDDFKEQQTYLRENRKRRMLVSAYRSYLKYLKYIKAITRNELFELLDTIQLPKKRGTSHGKKSGRAFPWDQWGNIVKNAPNRVAKMGIWLGFNFGLRLSEIIFLRVQDVDLDQGLIHITGENRSDGWHPKHYRERVVPISSKTHERVLTKWLKNRPKELNHPYLLWVERTGLQVRDRTFQRWCKGAHPDLRPHDLRRSYATNLYYKSDKDVKTVQLALGHSNVGTTSNYLHLEEAEYLDKIRSALS
jgi:integrase